MASSAATSFVTAGVGGAGGGESCMLGPVSTTYPAPHAKSPVVVDYGGPVLAMPKIVPVFFAGDDPTITATILDFLSKVAASKYWAAATSEYGVGPAQVTMPVQLTETAPATLDDDTIQLWLAAKLDSGDPAWPAPDGNTLYVLHYPDSVTITLSGGGVTDTTCQNIGGYHNETSLDDAHDDLGVPYAVIPRCHWPGESMTDTLTSAESHELIEAATDPLVSSDPAYATIDYPHIFWMNPSAGSEVGDMCENSPTALTNATDVPYLVQRTWSNAAALAGHDPCVPAPAGEVYFNSVPSAEESVLVQYAGEAITGRGVKIPVGQTKTVNLDLFSDGDTGGPWYVDVEDLGPFMGQPQTLGLALGCSSGENGQALQLTITVDAAAQNGYATYLVSSTLGDVQSAWVGLVGN